MKTPRASLFAACLAALPLTAQAQVVVTSSDGFTVAWDGNDGDGFNPESPAPVPANLASGVGAEAFTSSDLGPLLNIPFHVGANLNDGLYGNSNSWIGGDAPTPYAAIRLPGIATITSFAFGRDNGNGAFDDSVAGTDACGGQCDDRSLGIYTVQITRVSFPDGDTADTGDAATGWQTIGTLEYAGSEDPAPGDGFTAHLRHEYEIAAGASGVQATGFRLLVPTTGIAGGTAIDEIELYGPGVVDPDKDGDGFDDVVEVELGFDPNNPASTPESKTDLVTAVEFSFWAAKNKKYIIEQSPDLAAWTVIETDIPGRGGEITRLYSITDQPKQHYRAKRQQ
jgi:hypothetical protein